MVTLCAPLFKKLLVTSLREHPSSDSKAFRDSTYTTKTVTLYTQTANVTATNYTTIYSPNTMPVCGIHLNCRLLYCWENTRCCTFSKLNCTFGSLSTVLQSMVFCGMCYITTTAAGVGLKYNTAAKGGEGHACVYGVHSGWLVCTSPRLLPRSTAIGLMCSTIASHTHPLHS